MKKLFRKFPLSLKLSLIGIVPLIFFIYLSVRYYIEKEKSARRFKQNIEYIQQTVNISALIDELQEERRLSFEKALHIEREKEIVEQYKQSDSIINTIITSQAFSDLTKYTFLDDLEKMRLRVDSGITNELIMHYYTTVIFRLGTLSSISIFESVYLRSVYKDLIGQRLLSEMANYLGILRANIYNVLYTGQNAVGTLYGLVGVYDIYKSYETEFLLKASPETEARYKNMLNNFALRSTVNYLDDRFKQMSFDSSYNADQWWSISEQAKNELRDLQNSVLQNAVSRLDTLYKNEIASRNRTLIILITSVIIVISIVAFTIHIITSILKEMKVAAQKLAKGITNIKLNVPSRDPVGSLARSINLIDQNYKLLADAAEAIGKGNFDVPIHPHGPGDTLGMALLGMKYDLQELTMQLKLKQQQVASAVLRAQEEERTKMGEELHDNVNQLLATIKLYLDQMQTNKEKRDEFIPRVIDIVTLAIMEIRRISHTLILPGLRGNTLMDSINELVEDIRKISSLDMKINTKDFDEQLLDETQKIAVYRIIQEQLNNILKYASASIVTIHIKNTKGQFLLFIEDDGRGFDLKAKRKGVGITNIINRAEMLNGSVEIDTSPGKGCRLKVLLETTTAMQ